MRKLRMMAKMARKARFMFIVTGDGRAKYMRDKGLVRGMGEGVLFQPRKLPNDANLIRFHDNVVVAAGVTFVAHDVINRMIGRRNGVSLPTHEDCIEVMDDVFIGSDSVILPGGADRTSSRRRGRQCHYEGRSAGLDRRRCAGEEDWRLRRPRSAETGDCRTLRRDEPERNR